MKQILKYILANVLENLRFAEAKHSVTIALSSGIIVFSANFMNKAYSYVLAFAVLTVVFCALSVVCSFIALSSKKIKCYNKNKKIKTNNLLFFENLQNISPKDYLEQIKKNYSLPLTYDIDNFDIDLAKNIIANSKIAHVKYFLFNFSLVFLFLGILFLVVTSILIGAYGL